MPVKTRIIHSTNAFGALEIPCPSGLSIVGVHPVVLNNRVGVITYLGARRCWGGNVAIGVRELRQNASRYLEEVAAGESFEITDRGHPVARLVPIGPASGDPRRGAGCPCVATAVDERHRGLRERPAESVGVQSRNAAVTGRRIGYLLHCRPYRPAPRLAKDIAGHRFRPSPKDSMVGRGPTALSASNRLRRVCSTVSGSWPAAATCQGPTAQASPHPGTAESFTLHRSVSA